LFLSFLCFPLFISINTNGMRPTLVMLPSPQRAGEFNFSCKRPTASRMPCSNACGGGGQPGIYTSTGMTWSTPPSEA
jgi:hypothetical protein